MNVNIDSKSTQLDFIFNIRQVRDFIKEMKALFTITAVSVALDIPITPNWRVERAHSTKFKRRKIEDALEKFASTKPVFDQVCKKIPRFQVKFYHNLSLDLLSEK